MLAADLGCGRRNRERRERTVRFLSASGDHHGCVAKARQVRKALEKLGWVPVGTIGSHRKYRKGSATRIFAHHDRVDLGGPALARIAKDYGVALDVLRRML